MVTYRRKDTMVKDEKNIPKISAIMWKSLNVL